MTRLEFTVEIAAPLDRVWAFFVPQRMPLWYGAEMDAHLEILGDAPDFAAGQKVKVSATLGRRGVGFTAVIMRYDWMRALEWQSKDEYGIRGMQRWQVESAAGSTRVQMVDEYEFPGRAARFFDAILMRPSVRRRDRAWLARLKRIAEGTADERR